MQSAFFKPSDLNAPGAIDDLLAFHKARFGDARMEDGGEGDGGGEGGDGDGDKGNQAGGATSSTDKGFPENTPLEQMSVEQREAYWKFQARKHETRAKAFDGLTPEQLAEIRDKASKHDAMERELMSDKDKAVAEARDEERSKARSEFADELVRAKFEALSAGRIDAERLDTLLEDLHLGKYHTDGKVDAEKVKAKVDAWAPAQEEKPGRRGPSTTGAGSRPSTSGPSLQSGAEIYAARKGRR